MYGTEYVCWGEGGLFTRQTGHVQVYSRILAG